MSNLCLTSSVHNHSNLCDGQSSLQEMAVAAWKQGVTTLGFTGHSHTPCDLEYCMSPSRTARYKGETSGNVQRVVSITADCDADALVVEVVKDGPACHTGAESCFFNEVYVSPELKQFSWQGLYNLIKGRKDTPTAGSYTTYLFEKGKEKILKKVGEECTEVIIAGEKEDKAETVYEISDLAYHVLVLMVSAGITVEDVTRELEKRHVIDHKVKQERMQ